MQFVPEPIDKTVIEYCAILQDGYLIEVVSLGVL